MEHDDSNGNVYALFPGIDTKPFGVGADPARSDAPDDGWSDVPAHTIAADEPEAQETDPAPPAPPPRAPVRPKVSIRRCMAAAAALTAGVSIAAARYELGTKQPAAHASHAHAARSVAAVTPRHAPSLPIVKPARSATADHAHRARSRKTLRRQRATGRSTHATGRPATDVVSTTRSAPETSSATRVVAPTNPVPSPAVTTPVAPQTTPVITEPSNRSPAASAASSHQTTSSPPAFGENGTLGPGHSPDS